jgi:hypothetical protein
LTGPHTLQASAQRAFYIAINAARQPVIPPVLPFLLLKPRQVLGHSSHNLPGFQIETQDSCIIADPRIMSPFAMLIDLPCDALQLSFNDEPFMET